MTARRAVVVAAALHVVYSRQHAVEASRLFVLPLTVDVAEFGFVVSNFCRGNKPPLPPPPKKRLAFRRAFLGRLDANTMVAFVRSRAVNFRWRAPAGVRSCTHGQLAEPRDNSCFISPDSTRDRRLNIAGQRSAPHFLPAHNATAVSLLSLLTSWAGAVASRVQNFIPSTSPVFLPPRSRFFL